MATESNFETLVQSLKLDEPWLPPKPWESVLSESGQLPTSTTPSRCGRLYDLSSVSEASLVRLVMYALQGVQSAVISIKKLSESFCADPADRSLHRIPSIWNRSLSTNALGKMLKSIAFTGSLVFLLHKFVEHFTSLSYNRVSAEKRKVGVEPFEDQNQENEGFKGHPRSLVNQAFAVAVEKVLQGYMLALNTVNTSAFLRRSLSTDEMSSDASRELGNLTSIVHSGTTVLEVYLHTKELRIQIEALGNLCGVYNVALSFSDASLEDLITKEEEEFYKFPRGGDLLTFLYDQLLVADPVHSSVLKFLFCQSLEPYIGFVRSWIYDGKINDPYEEFIIECKGNTTPLLHGKAGIPVDFPFATVRVREGTVAPCFLKNITVPLLRAGQQLQVVLKLLELCKYIITGDHTVEDILPNCSSFLRENFACASALSFSKRDIDDIVISRKQFYRMMLDKLERVMKNFDMKYHQVGLHDTALVHFDACGGNLDTEPSFIFDKSLISSAAGEGKSNEAPPDEDSEASSINEELSYATDPLESSECSSVDDFEEQNGVIHPSEQLDSSSELTQNYLTILSFSSSNNVKQSLQAEKPHHEGSNVLETLSIKELSSHIIDPFTEETVLRDNVAPSSGAVELLKPWISEMQYKNSESHPVWPLGGLARNPLYSWSCINAAGLSISGNNHPVSTFSSESLEEDTLCLNNRYEPNCMLGGEGRDTGQAVTKTHSSSISYVLQSWNSKGQGNTISMNPVFTRNMFLGGTSVDKETAKISCAFPCFNFSSLADPLEQYVGKSHAVCEVPSGLTESDGSAAKHIDYYQGRQNRQNVGLMDQEMKFAHGSLNSKNMSEAEDVNLRNVSGGSGWETLLHGYHRPFSGTVGYQQGHGCDACFEIPLDFVINKCLLQEILLQYNYVSRLTITLLEEGFDLQEHLLTLQRYHFMEIADWVELFITSLWHHKWCFKEADQRIPEIQGLLESSIQRSSCESDPNKDRLHIYVKDHGVTPVSSAIGIHSFNFIGLAYRVDWPISIILNPDTLRLYAEIFSFLIQVKLAVLSSTELWCSMKDLRHILSQPSERHELELSHFNSLVKLRHQIHHFVSTLEYYVLSQLSDVSWCRLRKSLEHQVIDLMDIKSVHMAYLTDSMHICFLADETQSTLNTIQSILQCALDFCSCLVTDINSGGSRNDKLVGNFYRINISKVLSIKQKFDKSLQQLHLDYRKCPKHGEIGLARFWSYLNYNEYYLDTMGSDTFNCSLIV